MQDAVTTYVRLTLRFADGLHHCVRRKKQLLLSSESQRLRALEEAISVAAEAANLDGWNAAREAVEVFAERAAPSGVLALDRSGSVIWMSPRAEWRYVTHPLGGRQGNPRGAKRGHVSARGSYAAKRRIPRRHHRCLWRKHRAE